VNHLCTALAERGIAVWVDRNIEGGLAWEPDIQSGLDNCRVLTAIMSPRVVESSYVVKEVKRAWALQKPVIPVLMEPCNLPPSLQSLASVQYIDLWGDFRAGVDRLLQSLASNGIYGGTVPVMPAPAPSEPVSSELLNVVKGNWITDLRFHGGPLQLNVSIGLHNDPNFLGMIHVQAQNSPYMPFAAAIPMMYPYRGFWSVNGRELFLSGSYSDVSTGAGTPFSFTTYFSRINPQQLDGFTIPDWFSCVWRPGYR
jgi:hypothetical protein